ncbi:MAG: hypothetical protein JNL05_14080 [Flavobacteriales bacterium]|nr:hypothetical protein [Flavobacteriales bacterium]
MRTIQLIALSASFLLWAGCATGENKDPATTQESTAGGTPKDTAVAEHEHDADQDAAYACPMHPEVTGKEGDSCPKCGMDLEKVQ